MFEASLLKRIFFLIQTLKKVIPISRILIYKLSNLISLESIGYT